ncbi:LysR substrate-binding domain-containing protein [Hufsiella ginkgonis]|uniref:LysR family transcriptional regulator n=1 Tax=Hufsiella ginkgonis TaxID=2695274 RepID=A0A7K1XTG6_9SPHI|nr:LysR substrate-binding domain-containing protein [Hufsiella ginkgonis]MXV14252.1 LysR family transcriptional regulator [Hufsiella ginkgonis]
MLSQSHQVFLKVAALLSFSKASEVLFISQPAVSKHIRQLERHYKASLFERKRNTIELTSTGKVLNSYLLQALQIERQLEFEMSTLQHQSDATGHLVVGASTTVALYIIPKVLSGFHRQHPQLEIRLVNRNAENITTALLNHEIDLGIVEVENKLTAITYQHFITDEIIAVCAAQSNVTRKETLTITDLVTLPIALRERGSGTLAALGQALLKNGIKITDLQVKVRLGGTEALKNFLLADPSIGFLPKRSVIKELASGELVQLNIPGLQVTRDFFFIQRKGSEEFSLTKHFIRYCSAVYNL